MFMFELIGMLVFGGIVAGIVIAGIEYRNDQFAFVFSFYGFAIIVARSEQLRKNLNKIKNTADKKVFFDVPGVRAFR